MDNSIARFQISADEDFRIQFVFVDPPIPLADRDLRILVKERATNVTRATLTLGSGLSLDGGDTVTALVPQATAAAWSKGEFETDLHDITDGANTRLVGARTIYDLPGRLPYGVIGAKATVKWVVNKAIVTAIGGIGPTGPANSLTIGDVTTLETGEPATADITGAAPNQQLHLGLPKGDTGDAATIAIGTVTTVAPGDDAAVTNSGDEHAAVLDFEIPAGAAATIEVGEVLTVAPGDPATVSNGGTSSAAVLDFGIPKGDTGNTGWSPLLAAVSDGARRVHQIADWTGGEGTKPTTGDYLSEEGPVSDIGDATDIRGPAGTATIADGDKGDITTSDDGDTWEINAGAVDTTELADGSATNAKLDDMAEATFKMRAAGAGTGAPIDSTAAQAKTALGVTSAGDAMITAASAAAQTALLSALVGDIGTGGVKGLVPAPAAGDGAAGKVLGAGGGWVSPSAGALVLIQSQVASSSATVDFTSGLDNTYDSYVVQIDSAKPSTDDVLLVMRVGTGAGPTWRSSGYRTAATMIRAGTSTPVTQALSSTNSVLLVYSFATAGIGNASGENYSGTVNFSNPEASDFCEIRFSGEYGAALPDSCFISGGGRYDVAGAITGIQFLMSSGTIASGRFSLYGIKKV